MFEQTQNDSSQNLNHHFFKSLDAVPESFNKQACFYKMQSVSFHSNLNNLDKLSSEDVWTVFYPSEFEHLLCRTNEKLETRLQLDCETYFQEMSAIKHNYDFRFQESIHSTPFLIGVFLKEKVIRLMSPKMSAELFLLSHAEIVSMNHPDILELRVHAEKMASLSYKNFPSIIQVVSQRYQLVDYSEASFQKTKELEKELTKKLLGHINAYMPSMFEGLSDFLLGLTAQYALLRIHLLKFLAILPSLDHDQSGKEVKRILLEALRRFIKDNKKAFKNNKKGQDRALNKRLTFLIKTAHFISLCTPPRVLAFMIRKSVRTMAKRFIAGESIELAEDSLKDLKNTGRDVTLDQLGELVVSESEADKYFKEVLKLIEGFKQHVAVGELNRAGINRAHVSIKVSALCSDFKPEAFDQTYQLVAPRLKTILIKAMQENVFINIDAEHYHYRDLVFSIYKKLLLSTEELAGFDKTGIVLQAYLRDAIVHLKQIIDLAKERKLNMPVRIVKGAYWDAETVEAQVYSFNAPQFLNKEETDLNFRKLIYTIYEAHPHLTLCIASHNFADHAFAEALRETHFPQIMAIEHQCLHMTYEALSTALAKMGWATRNYMPVGSLLVGMAYLVRRIMENSSQVGVLTIMRSHKKGLSLSSAETLFDDKLKQGKSDIDEMARRLGDDFFNITPLRSYLQHELGDFKNAFSNATLKLGAHFENPFKLHGETVSIRSSSQTECVVGTLQFATIEDGQRALSILAEAYQSGPFPETSIAFRTSLLVKTASLMLASRLDLAALIVYEAGKTMNEALADVDEAIDFLNFYAREADRILKDDRTLLSRGPTLVIAPWNFPLAISCGMVASALVSGNTVLLKPAEQTPLVALKLGELFYRAGLSLNELIVLPAEGETVGQFLVDDPRFATVVFTGSKKVGMMIAQTVNRRVYKNERYGNKYLAQAITEMGGKNAIIVTQNAELDETVSGILKSAFSHAGQKCSALSRVIVHESVKDKLAERLKEALEDIHVGPAFEFSTTINPIISSQDLERLKRQGKEAILEAHRVGGKVLINRQNDKFSFAHSLCLGPLLIELPYDRAFDKDSYAQKELFGPVAHLMSFKTLDQAIKLFNSTEYALTGGIFSQSQNDIDYLSLQLEAGNIYVNRTITGARVAIEPFGGFKLSGTGPKAGSTFYLSSFLQRPKNHFMDESMATEEGVDYELHNMRPSHLNAHSRLSRMLKFLRQFHSHFEFYYQGVGPIHKNILKDYSQWLEKNYLSFFYDEHKNKEIKGQLSFNRFNLRPEHALFISVNAKPTSETLLQVFSGIIQGTSMSILCRNKKSYQFWMRLKDALMEAGFSKDNVDVCMASLSVMKKALNQPKLSVLIFDGSLNDIENYVFKYQEGREFDLRMRKVLTSFDAPRPQDFESHLLHFTWVRSFAVNTMRHGAPLDLENN